MLVLVVSPPKVTKLKTWNLPIDTYKRWEFRKNNANESPLSGKFMAKIRNFDLGAVFPHFCAYKREIWHTWRPQRWQHATVGWLVFNGTFSTIRPYHAINTRWSEIMIENSDFCRAMLCKRGPCGHAVSVRPSVRLSRSCILSKRRNVSSNFFTIG